METQDIRQAGWALYGQSWIKPLALDLARFSDFSQEQWEKRLRSVTDRDRPSQPDPSWKPAFCQLMIYELGKRREVTQELKAAAGAFC